MQEDIYSCFSNDFRGQSSILIEGDNMYGAFFRHWIRERGALSIDNT